MIAVVGDIGGVGSVKIDAGVLRDYVRSVYCAAGVPRGSASVVAGVQVDTDLRGVSTHGTRLVATYVSKLLAGSLNRRPAVTLTYDAGSCAALDADRALGPLAGTIAMTLAVRRARRHGAALVIAGNAGHAGAAGSYPLIAADAGMIGVAVCQTGSASVAPYGTSDPVLGNTALAVALPRGPARPVLLDMACGSVSWGQAHARRREGARLPDGCALDSYGEPTGDPRHAVTLCTFGGAKGSALAIVVELLASAARGALTALAADGEGRALWVCAVDPAHLGIDVSLPNRIEEIAQVLGNARVMRAGQPPRLPGDRAWEATSAGMAGGIPLDDDHVRRLTDAGRQVGIDTELPYSLKTHGRTP